MSGLLVRAARRLPAVPVGWAIGGSLARPGATWRSRLLERRLVGRLALIGVTVAIDACVPQARPGGLQPTLTISRVDGGEVAMQDGVPVPTFERQSSRQRIDLDGEWRIDRHVFDSDLSLTPRSASLEAIVAQGAGRTKPDFDDRGWETTDVPGSLNPPPDRKEVGAWYRRTFYVGLGWDGRAATLKFEAVNYLADVWLNGSWLGYHEGGTTPFALDAGPALKVGSDNVLVVRVDNPAWGTRNDIVPWGLADWWNFGGILRDVWLEGSDPVHVARADVAPHLDGADVSIVLQNQGPLARTASMVVDVLPAQVTAANLLDPDPQSLEVVERAVPRTPRTIVRVTVPDVVLDPGKVVRVNTSFLIPDANLWKPASPGLYLLRVTTSVDGAPVDTLYDTFGLRKVAVDPQAPAVTLNGQRVAFPGVALHDQVLRRENGRVTGSIPTASQMLKQLGKAREVGAQLIRTGHAPANPLLLQLADRMGFAVWEEIPLYHSTPQTFGIAMGRGIPQQMLREMALRDMNRPSVLFHGLANEATGEEARTNALRELRDVDRAIDGTRLTGQAAYGFAPADPSSEPLDVAGYTFYHGVFYGSDPVVDTAVALEAAHRAYPTKPIVILEFGRWADTAAQYPDQTRILNATGSAVIDRADTLPGGYVAAGVWWTLEDYATLRPTLEIEHFGLFDQNGRARPVAGAADSLFRSVQVPSGEGASLPAPVARGAAPQPSRSSVLLLLYAAYGLVFALVTLTVVLGVLVHRGGRGRHGPVQQRRNGRWTRWRPRAPGTARGRP